MNNSDMVTVPRAWLTAYLDDDRAKVEVNGERTSLWELLSTIADKQVPQSQSDPILWVTIYRKPGEKDRVESGSEDAERDSKAKTWGWSVVRAPLYLHPAEAR